MNVDDEDKVGPVITESFSSHSGACDWPSSSSLTARLRRLITAYQRSYRQEQLKLEAEAKGDRRRRRCEQASKLKEIARQERQQRYTAVTSSSLLWKMKVIRCHVYTDGDVYLQSHLKPFTYILRCDKGHQFFTHFIFKTFCFRLCR